jgi:S-sulfo-L-cysteine synthase (O-acetyl-L-serine-dependent)
MNISELIGNTPLVDLSGLADRPGIRLYGKLEGNNPGGSVKDRAALFMIQGALGRGELKPGTRLIEATSGNTGIALAMIAAARAIPIVLVMPENATRERVAVMRAYGAQVILTPAAEGMEGAIDFARERVAGGGYLMLDQFSNPDNPKAHYETTGPEIWRQTEGSVTHFVSAMGTTGTISGVSRFLKERNPAVEVIGAQPEEGSQIPGIRAWPPEYLPAIYRPELVDRVSTVSRDQSVQMTRRLAAEQGLFCGMSAGGAVFTALRAAEEAEEGVFVTIICDRGDRYLSSDLFFSP